MQIERLIQMVFLLVKKEHITSTTLAEYFGVSKRTILRDINTLSLSGIPIYTTKGSGGGISILKEYTIDKSLLTEHERERIVSGLQVLEATKIPNTEELLNKLNVLFKNDSAVSWIEVDFSFFGGKEKEKIKFNSIQESILGKYVMQFDYFTSELMYSRRTVEPLRLLFRHQAWYIFGYCRDRQDYRLFRTSRMKDIEITDEHFDRVLTDEIDMEPDYCRSYEMHLYKLKFSPEIAHRIYDEYEEQYVEMAEDRSFIVSYYYPINEWVVRHLLSFGTNVEVLEPVEMREIMRERAEGITAIYK